MKTLYVIDFMNLAFRNYHAFLKHNLRGPNGEPTGTLFGMTSFIVNLINEKNPTHVVVAMESDTSFRKEIFPDYKKNRQGKPSDFEAELGSVIEMFNLLGIPMVRIDDLEADDVVGSIVTKFKNEADCYIVSGDKDFMQLVDDNVKLLIPKTGGVYKTASFDEVREKFGCRPDQVVDVLALMGDSVDCIPGVQGIGPKNASKLIEEFGSLHNLYQNGIERLSKKQGEKLIKGQQAAFMSQVLAMIEKNADIPFDLDDLALDVDLLKSQNFISFCDKYGLKSIKNKILVPLNGLD